MNRKAQRRLESRHYRANGVYTGIDKHGNCYSGMILTIGKAKYRQEWRIDPQTGYANRTLEEIIE